MYTKKGVFLGVLLLNMTVVVATLFLTVSCNKVTRMVSKGQTPEQMDSLLNAAYEGKEYEQLITLANEFEASGDLTPTEANYWRGYACSHTQQLRRAELYWKQALEGDKKSEKELRYYIKSANRLASLLLLKNDFEGSLRVALPAVETIETLEGDSNADYANLLTVVASCQLRLDMPGEATQNYNRAYQDYLRIIHDNPSEMNYKSAMVCLITTTTNFLKTQQYEEALQWTEHFEQLLEQYGQYGHPNNDYIDKQQARINFYKATALQGLGRSKEAADAYRQAQKTRYAKTGDGFIEATDYLMIAQRWREAANNFQVLDAQMLRYNMTMSMDNIIKYVLPKFQANVGAGRKDTVIAVAQQICNALDSAVSQTRKNDAAELATIYDTQHKEAQIAQQQAELSQQRLISTAVALILVITFFTFYTLHKRKAAHRLAAAHEKLEDAHKRLEDAHEKLEDAHSKLQTAYDQLESTTKAKERIESELRIARNIQQSMLPSVFPDRDGLDLYGSMTPAKEVGGDLYDFLLQDQKLYICLGDVSGKGVPASLFMAQAMRMFRALAKEGLMPADIANRLNDELTAGNDNGMFVTMFIGLVDLTSGRMDFCNAGHNPPILGVDGNDQFMQIESNAPIGLWADLDFVGEHVDSVAGQMLLIYSDGLNEAENRQQQQFGDDRLLDILNHRHFNSSRELIDFLDEEVVKHRDGAEPNDDLTMLCLMVTQPFNTINKQ